MPGTWQTLNASYCCYRARRELWRNWTEHRSLEKATQSKYPRDWLLQEMEALTRKLVAFKSKRGSPFVCFGGEGSTPGWGHSSWYPGDPPYVVLKIEPSSATYKASTLPAEIALRKIYLEGSVLRTSGVRTYPRPPTCQARAQPADLSLCTCTLVNGDILRSISVKQ